MKNLTNSSKLKKNWKKKYLNMMVKFKIFWKILGEKLTQNFKKMHREFKTTKIFAGSITIGRIVTRQST